jgi:hypothetical protein
MIVVTQEGASRLWLQVFGIASIGYPYVHLYSNNYSPQHTDTYSTYAPHELSGGGYSPIQLVNPSANWTIAAIGAGAQASYVMITWTFTGAQTLWGYWLSDGTNTYSLWAEQFASSFVYGSGGGTFLLQLQPWLASQPSVGGIPCS